MNIFTNNPFTNSKYVLICAAENMFTYIKNLSIFQKPIFNILNEHILIRLNQIRFLFIGVILTSLVPTSIQAQDIHFSQYYNAPLTVSPALTGIFKGDVRLYGIYRSQWNEALTPYKTYQFAIDGKIFNPKNKKGFFSVGGQIFHDEAGDSNLRLTHIGVSGSYTLALDRENFLSFGLSLGFSQRMFDFEDLSWDKQFIGDSFSQLNPAGENFDNNSRTFADLGIGVNWHGQKTGRRSRLDVGMGAFHLTRPEQNFYSGDNSKLPMRFTLYILPTIQISSVMDIVLNGSTQIQDKYLEALGGGALRYYLNTKKTKELAVQLGASMRFNSIGDALVIATELHYRYLQVGFSYDLNVSDFREATNRNGGPELTARYLIHKVRPLGHYRICPLL